jgi:hypothetical protein
MPLKDQSQHSALATMGHNLPKHTAEESSATDKLARAFEESQLPLAQKLETFPRHVRRQDLSRFLAKYEVFQLSLGAHGSVVECGVFAGGGLFSWYHFAAILEPYNHSRRVIGFDTFTGFPSVSARDVEHGTSEHLHEGAFQTHSAIAGEIKRLLDIHDMNRPLGHIPRVELVEGDSRKTIPDYIERNPHLLISLLYLDFDLYEPTKVALDYFLPRVVGGGVVAFDELNCRDFPGETAAFLENADLKNVRLRRLPIDPYISYFVKAE